jgi:hypothetical protein
MAKTLPIQFVKTRGEQDIFKKEGSGDRKLPNWVSINTINENSRKIISGLADAEKYFTQRESAQMPDVPVLMIATINDKATAKSYRKDIRSIFDTNKNRNIIGKDTVDNLLVKIDDKQAIDSIKNNIKNTTHLSKSKKIGISAITNLKRFQPTYNSEELAGKVIKVKLANYLDEKINERVEKLFLDGCQRYNLKVKQYAYSDEINIYRIQTNKAQDIINIATLDGVISVKPMPYFEITASPEPENTKIDVLYPKENEEYPIVGLLDSGVTPIPHLKPWIVGEEENVAGLEQKDISPQHGTAVAGVMAYGDMLEGKNLTGCKPLKFKSFIVNTDKDNIRIEETEMVEYIRETVQNNPEIKVWNVSQGSTEESDLSTFSDFGMALDDIQKKERVLICKSAGNYPAKSGEMKRISKGADSVLSLVVGSIANKQITQNDVAVNERSPFSRIGFGPEYIIKPDVVHYGGNADTGINTFSETGYQSCMLRGTSFSTPRVTALAANIGYALGSNFDQNLIRALIIHSANYYNKSHLDHIELLKEQGFGLPATLDDILNNDPNEFSMIFQPEINRSDDYQILDFPYPKSLIENGYYYGEITVTVVTEPILKPNQGDEYCQNDIDVHLVTYSKKKYLNLNSQDTPKQYKNSDRLDGDVGNVLANRFYSTKKTYAHDNCEKSLISRNWKYCPVKKYHVNLEDMTSANKEKYLKENHKWCLKIKTIFRDAVEADRIFDGIEESPKVVIIITIRDTLNKGLVYNECMDLLNERNFEHSNVIVSNRIEINNGPVVD